MSARIHTVLVLTACVGLGCSANDAKRADNGEGEGEGEGDVATPTWYADVKPLVESSCVSCHQDGGVGTFSLDGMDATKLVGSAVADAVHNRRMPPWKAVDGCDDYRGDLSLTDDEIDTIVAWVDGGMPSGDAADAKSGTPMDMGGLDRVDLTLELPEAYAPNGENDDYRCFPIQWPLDYETYVTGYVVNPGRADLVHHVIAYKAPESTTEAIMAKDAEDDAPGYSCFGGPGVISDLDADWLGGWAPGAAQGLMPNGVGISMDPNSWVIVQVHYNLEAGAEGEDMTTIDVQIEEEVDKVGWIQPFADPSWVMGSTMEIPAGAEGITHEFSYTMDYPLEFHTANLHMHRLGTEARMSIIRADGTEDCMLAIDDWDFDWQRTYVFEDAKPINPGDAWALTCTWDNPSDSDVNWGEGTSDEMCLGSTLLTLR
jgi:hypothetical protein